MSLLEPEPKPPVDLIRIQNWFSRIVSGPLMREGVVHAGRIDAHRIRARNGVDGLERLAIYNRQYWFRLVDCLQEIYPCAMRLLGVETFNLWAMRFLDAHKSDSPYLADLDRGFPDFLKAEYKGGDRDLIVEAVAYDKAFDRAFDSPEGAPLRLESLQTARLALAPHATALWLSRDFGTFRRGDRTHALIPEVREHGALIHRHRHKLYEKEIPRAAYLLLQDLEQPLTLTGLFESLQSKASEKDLAEMEKHLTDWFRDWVESGWLCLAPPPQEQ